MKEIIILSAVVILLGLVVGGVYYFSNEQLLKEPFPNKPPEQNQQEIQISKTKIYRNKEWGFEFQHPESWKFEENSFYSPFSKFNLQGNSSAENYNPLRPAFLLNIVTPDFADRAVISRQNLGAIESNIIVGKIQGKKYEYIFEESPKVSIDIPFEEYQMIFGASKNYEDIFNQILVTFKFLE